MSEIEIINLLNNVGVPALLVIWLLRAEKRHVEDIAHHRRKEAFYINVIISLMTGKKPPTFDPDPEIDSDTLPNFEGIKG